MCQDCNRWSIRCTVISLALHPDTDHRFSDKGFVENLIRANCIVLDYTEYDNPGHMQYLCSCCTPGSLENKNYIFLIYLNECRLKIIIRFKSVSITLASKTTFCINCWVWAKLRDVCSCRLKICKPGNAIINSCDAGIS